MTLATLLVFLPAALLVGLSPGANNLLALSTAARAGVRPAIAGLAGRLLAFGVLIALVAAGLDRLLAASELAFQILKWGGILYLLWIAYGFWTAPAHDMARDAKPEPWHRMARREFLTLMGNPKAYLLLTAFLPQFIDPAVAFLPQMLLLGAVYVVMEGVASMIWIAVGRLLGMGAMTARRQQVVNRGAAVVMAGAAGLMTRAERSA